MRCADNARVGLKLVCLMLERTERICLLRRSTDLVACTWRHFHKEDRKRLGFRAGRPEALFTGSLRTRQQARSERERATSCRTDRGFGVISISGVVVNS